MNKIFIVIVLLIMVVSCTSIKKYNTEIVSLHSPEELRADIDKAYDKLVKLHPRLYQFISKKKLDYKFDSLKLTIVKPISSLEFYKKIAPVVSEVRQGHISVSPPSKRYTKKERKELQKKSFEFYELDFENVSDAFFVKANYGIDSTLVGAQVMAVNGDSIENVFAEYSKLYASDGYNSSFKDRFWALRFSSFYYKNNGYVDSLPITFKRNDSLFTRVLKRVYKDSIAKGFLKKDSLPDKQLVKLSVDEKREKRKKAKALKKYNNRHGYIKSKKIYTRNFNFIGKDSAVAYLKIRNFNNGGYTDFYKNAFQKINATKTKSLVIDLRDNTGGRISEILELYSYLKDEPFQFVKKGEVKTSTPFLKAFISKRNSLASNIIGILSSPIAVPVELLRVSKKNGVKYYKVSGSKKNNKPNKNNYKGKIYVLINGNSFSASSILATNLKTKSDVIFVGEETGGHYNGTVAGVQKYIVLKNSKVSLDFGMVHIQSPHENEKKGYGIAPDVQIIPTMADRLQNKDPELDWILNDIYN